MMSRIEPTSRHYVASLSSRLIRSLYFQLFVLGIVGLIPCLSDAEPVEQILTGRDIPKRIFIGSSFIFSESDSLFLSGTRLKRGIDYRIRTGRGVIELISLKPADHDTLIVRYNRLPVWLQTSYGNPVPVISETDRSPVEEQPHIFTPGLSRDRTGLTLTGAKSFRFMARTDGPSEFSQSLDLSVEGKLSPGVTLTGTVSDRGYNPSYGTADSRLNELDKVRLTLQSASVTAQVGDLTLENRMTGGTLQPRTLSGAGFSVKKEKWYVHGVAARPRGRYESTEFFGEDGLQGPYYINNGSRALPIVPGSEIVWLDGEQLKRGISSDYEIDYPTGSITFNVNRPIDKRSRIEVDYEPLTSDYKGELLASGGGVTLGDSVVSVEFEFRRDGDDKEQPLFGELNETDRQLLSQAGDSTARAVRSGVVADSSGNYVLVQSSLPDTVFQYVGEGMGEYRVTFSFVGPGVGSYRFLGGSRYEYVGVGLGDYVPVRLLAMPERFDYARLRLGWNNSITGRIAVDFRQSATDRNLFSTFDDYDNQGQYYRLAAQRQFDPRNSLKLSVRRRDKEFVSLERLNIPEFRRRFLMPLQYTPERDETLVESDATFRPLEHLTVNTQFNHIAYTDLFNSSQGSMGVIFSPSDDVELAFTAGGIRSELSDSNTILNGNGENLNGRLRARIYRQTVLTSSLESDNRKNLYSGVAKGTRYLQSTTGLETSTEQLQYEYYREDSLISGWSDLLTRHRVKLSSDRRIGGWSYRLNITQQWLKTIDLDEKNFLGRLGYRYHNPQKRETIEGVYTISTESRYARGVAYFEVEPGRGDFILEDSVYVPDPDGNYIQVDQILSGQSRVRRGEKSFAYRKEWPHAYFRMNSRINEELMEEGERKLSWIVPFISDESQPYLYYQRRFDADFRFWKVRHFHVINILNQKNVERRLIADRTRSRRHEQSILILKQAPGRTFLEQRLELFVIERDQYFGGAGVIDGFKAALSATCRFASSELTFGGSYRRARDDTGELSQLYSTLFESRLQFLRRGELRTSLELYSQQLDNVTGVPSYSLTDNKPGRRGAVWSVKLNYGVKGKLRLNFSLTGRHADNRTARVTGRTEMVAGF